MPSGTLLVVLGACLLLSCSTITLVSATTLYSRACVPCNPSGAKSQKPPDVGPDLAPMYADIVESVKGIRFQRREAEANAFGLEKRDTLCCAESTQCILMSGLSVPFCYDKFTTNFFLPDGSYGTISNGSYTSNGRSLNLITGEVPGGGENIYSAAKVPPPNTSTMPIPPQFTGTGVGGAIPITELGSKVTTVIVGPTTLGPVTIKPTTVSGKEVKGTTVSAMTVIGTTTATLPGAVAQQTGKGEGGRKGAGGLEVGMGVVMVAGLVVGL